MNKTDLVAHIESVQKAVLKVENDADSTPEQKADADEEFGYLQRAKNAVKRGVYWIWNGVKRVYMSVTTFLKRFSYRVKNFLSTVWTWLKGIGRVIIDAVVGAFTALGAFLGRIVARFTGGVQDILDKGVRIVVPSEEDDQAAIVREGLAETKRLDRPDLEERCEAATAELEAAAEAAAA